MEAPSCFRRTRDGLQIAVRLTPKSSRDAVEGIEATPHGQCYLKARVRAVPEDGKANRALEKLLAGWFGVAQRDVSVTGGATSRLKTVAVVGDADSLAAQLTARFSPGLPPR